MLLYLDTFNYGDKIKKAIKKRLDYLNETVIINENKNCNKLINSGSILLATTHLTAIECQILFVLMTHIGWNEYSCYIIKLKNRNFFTYLNCTDVKEIINCSDSSFNRAIKNLKDKK